MNESQEAYDRILRPIEDRMIQSIWRIVRNSQDAEDALQNALVTIWKRWDRVTQHPCPEALVLKMCADAAYDLTRRKVRDRKRNEPADAAEEPADKATSPTEGAINEELHFEVTTAIHRLPRQQAIAVLMRVIQGQSYQDVATALECSEATARTHVARGRTRLQTFLSHLDPTNAVRS
ncbi:MAG: RNA polymerase sigma factor [Planctomycetes bacterium]|nr:RNA polymerase sigma factor [Planctomycetota bacterium]